MKLELTVESRLASLCRAASLDHSMWFHSGFRMDEWMLYEMESPRLNNERGLAFGKIFRRDGTLAVTVSQEGLLRLRKDRDMESPTVKGLKAEPPLSSASTSTSSRL